MEQIKIADLIEQLNILLQNGNTNVQYEGTLMCQSEDNYIILTTEKQW